MRLAAAVALLLLAGCGIKGPPLPPRPEPPVAKNLDGGSALRYRGEPPEHSGKRVRLRWVLRAGTARGRLAVEEHRLHAGSDGPACGRRRLVGLLAARPMVELWVAWRPQPVRYRLLDARGVALAPPIRLQPSSGDR